MRRAAFMVIAVSGLVVVSATPALGRAPTPSPPAAQGTPPETVCTISDDRLVNLTGLVETDTGYSVVQKRTSGSPPRYVLDQKCKYLKTLTYGPNGANDPQDLAVTADGTQWAGDFGDDPNSGSPRATIAVWKIPPNNAAVVIYRLTYPAGDGPHDARALVMGADGNPIVITKETNGTAGLYVPSKPMQPNITAGVPLVKKGEFKIPKTTTHSFLGTGLTVPVTGAASAPDGKRVVLRTFSDAFEWDVTNGDVVGAITGAKAPRVTPLPDEPQGEAIAYTRDGKSFLTISDVQGETKMLKYAPVQPLAAKPSQTGPAATAAPAVDSRPWYRKLSLRQFTYLIGGVGLLGVVLVIVGVVGIRRSRNTRPEAPPVRAKASVPVANASVGRRDDGYDDYDADGYDNAGYDRGGYDRGGYDRGGYDRGGYDRAGQERDGYGGGYDGYGQEATRQGVYGSQARYGQGGYDQAGYGGQGGYDDGGYEQGGYGQGGHGQGGHGDGGYGRGGYDQGQQQGYSGYDDYEQRSDHPRR